MTDVLDSFVNSTVQCVGCPVFDRLFQIVSDAAAAAYGKFVVLCMILFCVLFAFVILNMVWKNMRGGASPAAYQKSLKTLAINSLVTLTFLGMGVALPRFVSTITFEPAAKVALIYTQSMLQTDNDKINARVDYQPAQISDNGFFRPQLRNTIIMLMKTTITQFQNYMKLGIAIMNAAFDWGKIDGFGSLIKHIILLFIGGYLFYGFFKFFINFCFYFVDIIVAMTFFAFFFPLGLMLMAFKGSDAPGWISGLGASIGAKQIKDLINAIITLAAAVITYTVIMIIIANFFAGNGTTSTEIVNMINAGEIFDADLSADNVANMTIAGCVVLVYVLNYIYGRIPEVTKMVLQTFDVAEKDDLSKNVATQVTGYVKSQLTQAGNIIKTVVSGGKSSGGTGGGGTTP